MATEYPPLNKIYVFGYSANDRDFPILSATADPRVAGYQVPKDLSACPDKRYPNHVFTGAQPISGDQRVRHVWEILPSPYVPFTRYDDDLGPVQGRRRSVKNEGQVATRQADKQVTYDAREGSAIVYTELEETWSIATDDDGNSLFPIRDRDFYDPSRGPVQERRQILVPTGEEEASLENVNGVITQTSYEPYNDFLSVKVVQTYRVAGPQLIGNTTNNDGQLVTVTTQRKAADDYVAPSPTATRTVEASREDAESLVERIVDTPEVFKASQFSIERPDPAPEKFRVEIPTSTTQETLAGEASEPTLNPDDLRKSEEQLTLFTKRTSTTSRDSALETTLVGGQSGTWGEEAVEETYTSNPAVSTGFGIKQSRKTPLGGGKYVEEIVNYPDADDNGVVYTLQSQEQDETTKAIVSVEKSLVDASLSFGYANILRGSGYTVEVQPVDKWHSITIASKITGSPQNESWTETGSIDLPNVLQEVGVIWNLDTDKSGDTAGVDNISEIVAQEYRWQVVASGTIRGSIAGNPYVKVNAGYRGAARMNVARTFHFGAPSDSISIHKFEPVYGTINVFGQSAVIKQQSYSSGVGDVGISSGTGTTFNSDTSMVTDQFGPLEWSGSSIIIQDKGDPKTFTDDVNASGGSVPGGGIYPAISATIELAGSASIELPISSIPKTSGQSFIRQVDVKPWRLGWWVKEVYTAIVP